jgi:hypothetical protein
MRKTIGAFLLMAAVAAAALGFYKVSARPRSPEQVVLNSYEYLRRGNLSRLERCYTEQAWEIMASALPAEGDRQGIENLMQYMNRLGHVKVTSTVVTGTTADVETVVRHDGVTEHERFRLILVSGLWRID